jgi:hypothetical protein
MKPHVVAVICYELPIFISSADSNGRASTPCAGKTPQHCLFAFLLDRPPASTLFGLIHKIEFEH